MDYAQKRQEAQEFIKKIISQEKTIRIPKLYLMVTDTRGLGTTFVNKYLKLLEINGAVNISKDEVEWVD